MRVRVCVRARKPPVGTGAHVSMAFYPSPKVSCLFYWHLIIRKFLQSA